MVLMAEAGHFVCCLFAGPRDLNAEDLIAGDQRPAGAGQEHRRPLGAQQTMVLNDERVCNRWKNEHMSNVVRMRISQNLLAKSLPLVCCPVEGFNRPAQQQQQWTVALLGFIPSSSMQPEISPTSGGYASNDHL